MLKNKNKRHSAPSAAAGSASQQMMPWGSHAPPNFYAWPQPSMQVAGPMFNQPALPAQKPWEDSESDSDGDFQPTAKKCKTLPKKLSKTQSGSQESRRGRGRPSKKELEERDYIASIPEELDEFKDAVALLLKDECRKCKFYKGQVALKPCGHGLYCCQCINKLRRECIKLKRPAKCPKDECYSSLQGWLQVKNVSG